MTYPAAILPVYRRAPVRMVGGEGAWLWDDTGKRYLDFGAGIAVTALGHGHPSVLSALHQQADALWHCSNLFSNPLLESLSQSLVEKSGFASSVFFSSSGAEANEAAIKFIRRTMYHRGQPDRYRIITIQGGFHGRTLACISACKSPRAVEGFGPLVDGFDQVPFHDIAALEAVITPQTAGVLLEPIQGEGGVHAHSPEYLQALRALTRKHGIMLWLDEVQCGLGRTGTLFAYEGAEITPDILTIAKGLGNGFPVGATLVNTEIANALTPGCHGSTFGSSPLAMAVASAVFKELCAPGLHANVRSQGATLLAGLQQLVARYPHILAQARGVGLMLGLQTNVSAYALMDKLRDAGMVVVAAGDNVLRLLPPLTIDETHVQQALAILESVCKDA